MPLSQELNQGFVETTGEESGNLSTTQELRDQVTDEQTRPRDSTCGSKPLYDKKVAPVLTLLILMRYLNSEIFVCLRIAFDKQINIHYVVFHTVV